MGTRLAAAGVLAAAVVIAWITITVPIAARALQLSVVASMGYVAFLAWRGSRVMRRAYTAGSLQPVDAADADPAPVSLVIPARNEAGVIGSAVRALAALDYLERSGGPAYELVVVDDASTDATRAEAAHASADHPHVRVVPRAERSAPYTKAAVLADAMAEVRHPIIGVVDADTHVAPGFLAAAMAAWRRDPSAAALQVARHPRNASASWLTAAQAEEQLMDMASQCGRWATDGTAELRGNGMFVRRDALEDVGGWNRRALTEDLDLSTRLAAAGSHVALAPEVAVEEEAVETLPALWHQRMRWAEGSLRRLLEHGPPLLLGPQPLSRKADFVAFAAEFLLPPLFATTIVASLVTIPLPGDADWTVPATLFAGYGLGVFLLALGGLSATGERGVRLVGRALRGALFLAHWLLVVPAALLRILFGPEPRGFRQTPRFGGAA
jgi:1,2-diacylglycerol 3-beta-glucosyltransferase